MRTKLPLIYDNEKLVGACLYHASQRTNIPLQLPNGQTYEQMFGLTQANLDGEKGGTVALKCARCEPLLLLLMACCVMGVKCSWVR